MTKNFSPEERLLVLLNIARRSPALQEEVSSLGEAGLDWENLFKLAELNATLPLSWKGLESAGLAERIPAELAERWQAKIAPITERNAKRVAWTQRLLEALHEAGVEVIVLKGSMLAGEVYHDLSYKKMNDVDVLVRRDDVKETIAVLKELKFKGVGALFGKNELSAQSHHTPPYVSADLACVVGLHWGLVSPLSSAKPDTAGIWKRRQAIQVAGAPAFRMSWEDNLLHLCIHLPFFKTGLRELADVYNLVLHAGSTLDWEELGRRARHWDAEDSVFRVLALTNALVDLGISNRLWNRWSDCATQFTLSDTEKRLIHAPAILRSRSTQAAKIEKAYAVFALSENYTERLKAWAGMWALLLWPKEEELAKLAALESEKALRGHRGRWMRARVRAPLQLWNAMARDHGHLPLAAMTVANAGILARETAKKVLGRGGSGRKLKEHPAVKLLEVLE